MENQAETIYINDNGVQKIMCPFCGTLHSPTRKYYPSKSDAEDDAAAQCACDEAREWRKISVKKPMIRPFIAGQGPSKVEIAACRFCGQTQPIPEESLEASRLTPAEYVSRVCKCTGARTYQDYLEKEQERSENLQTAAERIRTMFFDGEEDMQERELTEALLHNVCELVYDEVLKKGTIQLNYNTTAVIKKNNNGGLKIEKKWKASESTEI